MICRDNIAGHYQQLIAQDRKIEELSKNIYLGEKQRKTLKLAQMLEYRAKLNAKIKKLNNEIGAQ